jgi:hypothetical protein
MIPIINFSYIAKKILVPLRQETFNLRGRKHRAGERSRGHPALAIPDTGK